MKLTVFIFLFSFSLINQAQTYKPLLDKYNEWRITYCFAGNCSGDTYFTNGDIQNGGYQYKILDGYHFISGTLWLREDTLTQKVYLSHQVGTRVRTEDLLYDFSLQVGDSIDMINPISPFPTNAGYFTVDSIVMEQLQDGNNYRHYYLSPISSNTISTNTAEWVEGVGSLSLINAPSGFPDLYGVGKLSCFFKNGVLFYSNLDSITGCIPTIVLNIDKDVNTIDYINVYPTFVENQCHISGITHMKNIAIYNVNGTLMKQQHMHNTSEVDIYLGKFNSGMYFLVLSDEKSRQRIFKVFKK